MRRVISNYRLRLEVSSGGVFVIAASNGKSVVGVPYLVSDRMMIRSYFTFIFRSF